MYSTISSNNSVELEAVKELSDQDFQVIAEAAIVFLNDQEKLESLDRLNKSLVQVENCKDIAKWLLKTLKIALRQSVEPTKLEKFILTTIGLDDESKLAILKQLWEKHWLILKDSAESGQSSLMISQLVDMEWKFGVSSSTNAIDKFGSAFLQLKLVYNKGSQLEAKFMELNLPQFYSFLHEMNKAKSQMDYLS